MQWERKEGVKTVFILVLNIYSMFFVFVDILITFESKLDFDQHFNMILFDVEYH